MEARPRGGKMTNKGTLGLKAGCQPLQIGLFCNQKHPITDIYVKKILRAAWL